MDMLSDVSYLHPYLFDTHLLVLGYRPLSIPDTYELVARFERG